MVNLFPIRSVPHCIRCSQFHDALLNRSNNSPFLMELWFEHQDRADDLRCWNAYMPVFDPSKVVDIEKMERDDKEREARGKRELYEKLKTELGE